LKPFNLVSLTICLLSAGLAAPLPEESSDLPPPAGKTVDYSRDVAPLLESRCYLCHGPQQQMKGLRLDRAEDALRGGESGAVIRPFAGVLIIGVLIGTYSSIFVASPVLLEIHDRARRRSAIAART